MNPVTALLQLGGVADLQTLLGLTSRKRLRTSVKAGLVVRDARGWYALPTAREGARAAARLHGVASHLNAAAHWGWKTKAPAPLPSVTVPRNRRVSDERREGVDLHYADLSDEERRQRVTSRRRTVIDCAKALPFDEALAVADSALRNEDLTWRELQALAAQVRTSGRVQCLRVAKEADGRAANPFESVLRAISLDVPGLHLEPQQVIQIEGQWIQPDLLDAERRIVVEAESYAFHSDQRAFTKDCERYNTLGRLGWTVYRFTWHHVMHQPGYVAGVLACAAAMPPRRLPRGHADVQLSRNHAG